MLKMLLLKEKKKVIFIKDLKGQGKKGDINLDSKVDIADAVLLQKSIFGNENLSGEQFYAADILSDAGADIFDMIMMRKNITGNM